MPDDEKAPKAVVALFSALKDALAKKPTGEEVMETKPGSLHIWTNDYEWLCAASREDVALVMREHLGADDSDHEQWEQLPDDKMLGFYCDETGKIAEIGEPNHVVKKTCAEWIEQLGRGYIGSTEQ